MKLIKADHDRRLEIAGVPELVRRPVDIDKAQTGFEKLRSLRIYWFDAGSVINGHAEEDEVFIVVMAGSVELTMFDHQSPDSARPFTLSAASELPGQLCAAFLPPGAAYRLVPRTAAEVAYARATPSGGSPPHVFSSNAESDHASIARLLEESSYPRLLRIRLMQITATEDSIEVAPVEGSEGMSEALIHVRTVPPERGAIIIEMEADAETMPLESWDTVAVTHGEAPVLRVAMGSSALFLMVLVT